MEREEKKARENLAGNNSVSLLTKEIRGHMLTESGENPELYGRRMRDYLIDKIYE